ncbi:MAG: glycosidase [Candidatus Mariimomonas ferrooxydans]
MEKKDFIIGPFMDYLKNPILRPGKGFISKGIYNPTVIKEGKNFYMLFRAEAGDGVTGTIGLAISSDGIRFTYRPDPVIVPSADYDRFGCEDPRVVKIKDIYFLTYVGNSGRYNVGNICLATSKDLLHWEKHGQILQPKKGRWDSGQIKAGAILPEKINGKYGKYIMYFMGEEKPWKTAIGIAYSEDLFNWYEPHDDPVVVPRKDHFDNYGVEPGPNPVVVNEGILLIYNGWGRDSIYKPGGILFSVDEPSKIIKRTDEPILLPCQNYGKEFGTGNHVVAEGLIMDGNRWLLYYGAADRVTCLAIYDSEEK